jgi:hypothetical protein
MMREQLKDGETGKFVSPLCPDLNCGGLLIAGQSRFGDPVWHCDGLTHRDDLGPLVACEREVPRARPTDVKDVL